ncbi:MAG TPA: enolase C-terminal domain-like protein [Burkholderiales bacterium]|nr:enolase C-terminal domain-like protein [Burkholderiales bacterium]
MARLAQVRLTRLRVPLRAPYRLAFGPVEHFDTILVECDAEGRTGLGEATVLTGYTEETIEGSWRAADEIAVRLAGMEIEAARVELRPYFRRLPFTTTAFATALEMLEGSDYLRIEREQAVPLLAGINATGEQAVREEFERLYAQGYRTFKVKVGFDVEKDLAHVRTVQTLSHGRSMLRIDANQGYSAEQAMAFASRVDPDGIELFEQPCPAADWESHMKVVGASRVPMMLDESIYGLEEIERAASLGAAKFVKLKLMKLGTMAALGAALDRIRALGMTPVLGNGVACDLGCWMEACVAARHIDNAGEMNGFLRARAGVLSQPLEVREGALILKPGFVPALGNVQPYVVDKR